MTNGTIDSEEERRNVEAVRRAYAGYSRGDPQPFFDMCAEDIRFGIAAAPEHFDFAGMGTGMAWVKRVLGGINQEFEWLEFGERQLIAEGEWIIARGGGRIRDRETGEVIEPDLVDVMQIKDGKVVYFAEYFDTTLMQKRDAARAKLVAAQPKPRPAKAKATSAGRAKPKRAAKPKAKAKPAPKRAAAKRTTKAKPAAKPKAKRTSGRSAPRRR
jgi:ketosteroid isomerase-like protein